MAVYLYVGNLSSRTDEATLRGVFSRGGRKVGRIEHGGGGHPGEPGFAYVELADADEAEAAIAELHGECVDGRTITVNFVPQDRDAGSWESKPPEKTGARGAERGEGSQATHR